MHISLGYITDAGYHRPGHGVPATASSTGQLLPPLPTSQSVGSSGCRDEPTVDCSPSLAPSKTGGSRLGSQPGTISASKQSMKSNTASCHFYFGMLVSFCLPLISQNGQQWQCMNHTVTFTYGKGSAHSLKFVQEQESSNWLFSSCLVGVMSL